MPTDKTDEEIIVLYKNGDRDTFKILLNRYADSLYNFAARLTNKNDASDIVQEVFIKIWKNIYRFNPAKASFKTWIFTIAKNTITDFQRKKRWMLFSDLNMDNTEDTASFEESIPAEELLPDETLQKMEDNQFLNKIMEKLPPDYREVLMLHYQEEMTFSEIGNILDKPLNTVKSRHNRALKKLKEILSSAPN